MLTSENERESTIFDLDEKYMIQCLPKRDHIAISKAQGTKIIDSQGKEYLDLFSGISVTNVGHCHPKVMAAIKNQIELYMHLSNHYYNNAIATLAKQLVTVTPQSLSKVFFADSDRGTW